MLQPSNWIPCPFCGRTHAPTGLNCSKCGRYFATGRLSRTGVPAREVLCGACGSPNYDYKERCWKCLAPLAGAASSPNPQSVLAAQPIFSPPPPSATRHGVTSGAPPATAPQAVPAAQPGASSPVSPAAQTGAPTLAPAAAAAPAASISVPVAEKQPPPPPSPLELQAQEEVRSLSEAIENGRGDSDTYELRASYLIELGRLDEAEVDLEHISNGVRRDVLQGDIAAARGRFREASDIYEGVLAADPSRSGVTRKLARLYVRQKSFRPEEVSFVRQTLDQQFDRVAGSPDWVPWITFLHERYTSSNNWEEELGLLRQVLERNPLSSNPRLGLWLVDALLAQGALEEAQELLPQLSLQSRHQAVLEAYRHTARALVRAGQNGAAQPLYAQLAEAGEADASRIASMLEQASDGQRFVPLQKVGAGAAAEVWKAFDLYSGEEVGLKILHESLLSDPIATVELQREYEVMSSSLCPRLARVIPGTLQEDRFAMDLLDHSLVDLLLDPGNIHGLSLKQSIEIAQQVAEGIEYLHARGYVYQDLSPQNILFKGNSVKLCDLGGLKANLGGAEALDAPAALNSAAAATVAKVAYASPEQCALLMGHATTTTVDRRSDIYSLGVVLYQMVTGRLPFEGPDQAVLHAHLYSTPVAPIIHRPSIGRELNAIVLRCMAQNPDNRFPTAAQLWEALESVEL